MTFKSDFESDATYEVFNQKIDGSLCRLEDLKNAAKHYQLAVRSRDELAVLDAKMFLDECSLTNWKYYKNGHKWIQALETIYMKSQNVREKYYALKILKSVEYTVNDRKAVAMVVNSVQTQTKDRRSDKNPHRRWKDSVLSEKNVPSREGLVKLSRIVFLCLGLSLPKEISRRIVSFT